MGDLKEFRFDFNLFDFAVITQDSAHAVEVLAGLGDDELFAVEGKACPGKFKVHTGALEEGLKGFGLFVCGGSAASRSNRSKGIHRSGGCASVTETGEADDSSRGNREKFGNGALTAFRTEAWSNGDGVGPHFIGEVNLLGDELQDAVEAEVAKADVDAGVGVVGVKEHHDVHTFTGGVVLQREFGKRFDYAGEFHTREVDLWDDDAVELALGAAVTTVGGGI